MLSAEGQRAYGQQKLVPLHPPLLFVNDTNRSFVSAPSLSYITPLSLSFLHFLSFLLKDFFSPSVSFCPYPFGSSVYLLFSTHPSSSPSFPFPLLARWLLYHWDGCRIKDATLFSFFFLHHSFSAPLSLSFPSLILVSSHCGAFNASYHMVAESNWRCGGAFIGASKHSCNNACQGSGFFITLMLHWVNPTNYPSPLKFTQLLFPSLNTEPQIGWDSLLEGGNHKPHNGCDVTCWRDAGRIILPS